MDFEIMRGISNKGRAHCWGVDDVIPSGRTWASISAGCFYTCGVTTAGEGFCWGNNNWGQCEVPANHIWLSISAGANADENLGPHLLFEEKAGSLVKIILLVAREQVHPWWAEKDPPRGVLLRWTS